MCYIPPKDHHRHAPQKILLRLDILYIYIEGFWERKPVGYSMLGERERDCFVQHNFKQFTFAARFSDHQKDF